MLRTYSLRSLLPGLFILTATFILGISATGLKAQAQTLISSDEITLNTDPVFRNYKGVTIGMPTAEVRSKLGEPKDASGGQDFYNFSEKEVVQIFYDAQRVKAISVTYIGEKSGAPDAKAVLGMEIKATADGVIRKPFSLN